MIEFTATYLITNPTYNKVHILRRNPYDFVGRVLTMLEGPARRQSTRIVGVGSGTDSSGVPFLTLQILPFENVPTAIFIADILNQGALGGSRGYIINGPAFTGPGFGTPQVAPAGTAVLDAQLPTGITTNDPFLQISFPFPLPVALFPNRSNDPPSPLLAGANEDYDAVDYQNMLLAMMYVNPATGNGEVPIPSLHRPALINYWYQRMVDDWLTQPPPLPDLSRARAWGAVLQPVIAGPPPPTPPPGVTYHNFITAQTRDAIIGLKRRLFFRPLPEVNDSFSGSNPDWMAWRRAGGSLIGGIVNGTVSETDVRETFWLQQSPVLNGPWDVDNDGDGRNDSIWVDLGMPVRTAPDGRRYKPLFAILCADMDGKLNLNAHGCSAHVEDADNDGTPDYYQGVAGNPLLFAGNFATAVLPRGLGHGPAEVNLQPLFDNDPAVPLDADDVQRYRQLLWGDTGLFLDGRYGEVNTALPARPSPGFTVGPLTGEDFLSYNKHFGYPLNPMDPFDFNYFSSVQFPAVQVTGYGTPDDLRGALTVGIDLRGQPVYRVLDVGPAGNDATDWNRSGVNDPYEIDLSRNATRGVRGPARADNPFTVNELEAILRMYDVDAPSVRSRLLELMGPAGWTSTDWAARRHEVTTESWDLPCPNLAVPPELHAWLGPNKAARHIRALINAKTDSLSLGRLSLTQMATLLPPELFMGLRMDVNRPFGNGRDDDGNQVVDEWDQALNAPEAGGETLNQVSPAGLVPVPFDHDNDGIPGSTVDPRLHYARHLYVLMMTLAGEDWFPPWVVPPVPPGAPGFTAWQGPERARAIAQWAVNVVDFRDRDSIMTGFEYDTNPFNGWSVDGVVGSADDGVGEWGLVWGCERPELLITETLAFHDRRTQDLTVDGGTVAGTPADTNNDFDQKWMPEGSLFVELFHPWTSDDAKAGELCYDRVSGTPNNGVLLNQRSDPGPSSANGDPVWRLAIVGATNSTDMDLDPDAPAPAPLPTVDAGVYFADPASLPPAVTGLRFYTTQNNDIVVGHNQYAVIGPGESPPGAAPTDPPTTPSITYVGFRTGENPGTPPTTAQTRRIVLDNTAANQVEVYGDGSVDDLTGLGIRPTVAVLINQPRRLSVSEPIGGYPATDPNGVAYDPTTVGYAQPHPRPLDRTQPQAVWDILRIDGTTPRFRMVHLQRLANPLRPWNAVTNPYLTIDSMQVDLTAFNGVPQPTASPDPDALPGTYAFYTRERGETTEAANPGSNNLWRLEQPPVPPAPPQDMPVHPAARLSPKPPSVNLPNHYFSQLFGHTLGYLNDPFGLPMVPPPSPGYSGDPQSPFPWFTWNNRPFVSELELVMVPAMRSSQLLRNYAMSPATPDPYTLGMEPYSHLLNFFRSQPDTSKTTSTGIPIAIDPGHFYRLLEFVHVPSRFIGTELQASPIEFRAGHPTNAGTHWFHPPFNGISRYRDPGRINLNTIFSPDVWQGLMNYFPGLSSTTGAGDFWEDHFIFSRRGYIYEDAVPGPIPPAAPAILLVTGDNPILEMQHIHADYPTRFANPFRSFAGRGLVPPVPDPNPAPLPGDDPNNLLGNRIREGINATLLRRDVPTAPATPSTRPLFSFDSADPTTAPFIAALNDPDRNPFFRYQGLQRLGNLVTTRSNVYAVWITVGYFEVLEAPPYSQFAPPLGNWTPIHYQAVYPDSYQLGPELGSDTGEIKRHRAFYLFDRSIPVGFVRGRDINVKDAILLERFIE